MAEVNKTENINIVIIYKSYGEAQKRAIKNYVQKNREKQNEYQRNRYLKLKENPEFMQKHRESSKRTYHKKKNQNIEEELNIKDKDI